MTSWETLRAGVYEVDGSWRDIYVLDATRADWGRWMHFVNQHYPVRWGAGDFQDGQTVEAIDVAYIERRWDNAEFATSGSVFVGAVQLNCHFFTDTQIENDLDPSQIRSLEDHHQLMTYLVAISSALGKEVIVTAENVSDGVYIRVNGPDIEFV